jgi:hypothetical protein
MQDKTINNALHALRKAGGQQGKLAEVLLDMRGVDWGGYTQHMPFKRGGSKALALDALKDGPLTTPQVGDLFREQQPELSSREATQRAYAALWRLKDRGFAVKDGKVWRLS